MISNLVESMLTNPPRRSLNDTPVGRKINGHKLGGRTFFRPETTEQPTPTQSLPVIGRKVNDLPIGRLPTDPVCSNKGGVLRQSSCDYCSLRHVKIDVRQCDVHTECIDEFNTRYRVRGVKKCQECKDYQKPTAVQAIPSLQPLSNASSLIISTTVPKPVNSSSSAISVRTIAYGITTVPERRGTTLPITLKSLANAGFHEPILFVDDKDDGGWGNPNGQSELAYRSLFLSLRKVFRTDGRVKAFGHWILSLYELFIRNPHADLYALFQDDIMVSRNLRAYLDTVTLPHRGYMNLYTMPSNQKVVPDNGNYIGFYKSNQNGKSATALVFDKEAIGIVLSAPHMIRKLRSRNHSAWKSIDGGVIEAFKGVPNQQWFEYVHNPSLVQHIGDESTLGNPDVVKLGDPNHWKAPSFRGEDFDCLSLLTQAKTS